MIARLTRDAEAGLAGFSSFDMTAPPIFDFGFSIANFRTDYTARGLDASVRLLGARATRTHKSGRVGRAAGVANVSVRAGIPEYWLIDAQLGEVSFQVLRRQQNRYVAVGPRGGWNRATVFGRSFRLERRKNRLGRWAYSLEAAPA